MLQGFWRADITKLVRLLTLSPHRWSALGQAYWLLLKAYARTKIGADPSGLSLEARPTSPDGCVLTLEQKKVIDEAVWSVDVASRHPFRWVKCLQRSLAVLWWLESRGVDADLQIGVRKERNDLRAHAWVEHHGVVLNDRQSVPKVYAPLVPAHSLSPDAGQRKQG